MYCLILVFTDLITIVLWSDDHLPVVCVVVPNAGCGVYIVCDQPMEVRVATDTDALHVSLGDVGTVRIEIPQDHHILEHSSITL